MEPSMVDERINPNYIGPTYVQSYFKKEKNGNSISKLFSAYNIRFIVLDINKFVLLYFESDQSSKPTFYHSLENLKSVTAYKCDFSMPAPKNCPYCFIFIFPSRTLTLFGDSEKTFRYMKAALSACTTFEKFPKEEFTNLDEFYKPKPEKILNNTLNPNKKKNNLKEDDELKVNQFEEVLTKNEITLHRQKQNFHSNVQGQQLNLVPQNKKGKDQKLSSVSKNQSFSFFNNENSLKEDKNQNCEYYDDYNSRNYVEELKDKSKDNNQSALENKLAKIKSISIMKNHTNHFNLNKSIENNHSKNVQFPKSINSFQFKNIKINPQMFNKIKKNEFINNYNCEEESQKLNQNKIDLNTDNSLHESNKNKEINTIIHQQLKNQFYKSKNMHLKQSEIPLKKNEDYEELPKDKLQRNNNTKSVPKRVFYKLDTKIHKNDWDVNSGDIIIDNNNFKPFS